MNYAATREFAKQADASDPLSEFRQEFNLPESRAGLECVYLCGNSLGLQSKRATAYLQEEVSEWARLGVQGHFEGLMQCMI